MDLDLDLGNTLLQSTMTFTQRQWIMPLAQDRSLDLWPAGQRATTVPLMHTEAECAPFYVSYPFMNVCIVFYSTLKAKPVSQLIHVHGPWYVFCGRWRTCSAEWSTEVLYSYSALGTRSRVNWSAYRSYSLVERQRELTTSYLYTLLHPFASKFANSRSMVLYWELLCSTTGRMTGLRLHVWTVCV